MARPSSQSHVLRFTVILIGLSLFLCIFPALARALNLERLSSASLSNFELLDVEQRGDFLIVTGGLGGTTVLDIRDPENPVQIDAYLAGSCRFGRLYNTFAGDSLAVGAGRDCPLEVLRITQNYDLEKITAHQTGEFSYEDAVIVGDTLVLAAAHTDGIEAIDVSVPSLPVSLGSLPLDNAWAVRAEGTYAYVADGAVGLSVVDFSDPSNLRLAGRVQLEGSAKDVRVRGGHAFLALGDAGVAMIDVTDPESPVLLDTYDTSGLAAHIGVSDSLVAVADWDDVEILKYSPSGNLELVGKKNSGGRVMGIEISGDLVSVAEWTLMRFYRYGPVHGADLDIDLLDVHFPRTDIGESVDTTLTLENNGLETLTIESIVVSFDDYTVDVVPPVSILPGQELEVTVTYTPSILDGKMETITFTSNDTDDPSITVDVWGNDVDLHVGDPAPDFTLPLLGGGEVTLSNLEGSVVVLSFFASW